MFNAYVTSRNEIEHLRVELHRDILSVSSPKDAIWN